MTQRQSPLRTARLALLAPMMALGACVSLGVEPPDSLLTLTPSATAPAGENSASANAANSILVLTPEVPAKLDVLRVPVQVNETEIAYLQNAFWVEPPARLFRALLGEALRAEGGVLVLDNENTPLSPDRELRGTLREFGYDSQSGSVIVQFDAIRSVDVGVGIDERSDVQSRRFEARIGNVAAEPASVGLALNEAANQIAGEVAEWASAAVE